MLQSDAMKKLFLGDAHTHELQSQDLDEVF